MEPRGYRLRSVVLKLMLVATAATTAFVSYGSVRGVEAGISLLVVLASLKILEAHTAREFRVMFTAALLPLANPVKVGDLRLFAGR